MLQPLRSEVVKRQTELLVELLDYISNQNQNIYFSIDYMGIICCNTYKLLDLCDFVFTDEKIGKTIEEKVGGCMLLKTEGMPCSFCAPTDPLGTHDTDVSKRESEYKKQLIDKIHFDKSISNLEVLYLTKTHIETIAKLESYRDNPFMPKQIQNLLCQLLNDITANIKGPLLKELENLIVRVDAMPSDKESPLHITYQALYNSFLRYAKSHTTTIKDISESIRQYLYVDAKWS